MAERLTQCSICDGRGYFNCECRPADCYCGYGDENCDECGGTGFIDENYCDHPEPEASPCAG